MNKSQSRTAIARFPLRHLGFLVKLLPILGYWTVRQYNTYATMSARLKEHWRWRL